MNTDQYIFTLQMQVRDYELDYQGIVNNANYLHYLEHTRHEFCREAGLTFADMHRRGIDPVLAKIAVEYKQPLRSDETFISCLNIARKGPKFVFKQDLYKEDGTPVLKAEVSVVCIENGQLTRGDVLAEVFKDYLK
jgi:acyl-CoA thioester hydrolase